MYDVPVQLGNKGEEKCYLTGMAKRHLGIFPGRKASVWWQRALFVPWTCMRICNVSARRSHLLQSVGRATFRLRLRCPPMVASNTSTKLATSGAWPK